MAAKRKRQNNLGRRLGIAGAALILAYFAFPFLSSKKKGMSAMAPGGNNKSLGDIHPLPSSSAKQADHSEKERLRKARMRAAARFEIGLGTIKPKSVGGFLEIPVEFVPKKLWCAGGDLDTIRQSLTNVVADNLLISIESLIDPSRKALAYTSYLDLMKGLKLAFRIKSPLRGEQYGLFICEDSKKDGSCQKKNLLSFDELSRMNDSEQSAVASNVSPIFYFQQLIADGEEINTFDANRFLGKKKGVLLNQLGEQFDLSEKDIQKGWRYSSVVKSLSTEVQHNTIKAPLTYADTRCGGGGDHR